MRSRWTPYNLSSSRISLMAGRALMSGDRGPCELRVESLRIGKILPTARKRSLAQGRRARHFRRASIDRANGPHNRQNRPFRSQPKTRRQDPRLAK
jgi:hypothetical protein